MVIGSPSGGTKGQCASPNVVDGKRLCVCCGEGGETERGREGGISYKSQRLLYNQHILSYTHTHTHTHLGPGDVAPPSPLHRSTGKQLEEIRKSMGCLSFGGEVIDCLWV